MLSSEVYEGYLCPGPGTLKAPSDKVEGKPEDLRFLVHRRKQAARVIVVHLISNIVNVSPRVFRVGVLKLDNASGLGKTPSGSSKAK
jgi:hypothetical protein